MYLKELSLINFKNIEQTRLDFEVGINAFVGDNGAGKTNILDAIYYLSMCKSMLSTSDAQSTKTHAEFFVVDGSYITSSAKSESVVCTYSRQRGQVKKLKRNGKEYERLSDHIGLIPMVVVTPQDSELIYEAEHRRKFLNGFISQADSIYLNAILKYNALITQRNRLLKQGGDESMLLIYDEQLRPYAEHIHRARTEVIAEISPLVEGFYRELCGGQEEVQLGYTSMLNDVDYMELMLSARRRDIMCEYTTVGVHRDDMTLSIGGMPLRRFGSQGQQKSYLLALKLAQYMTMSRLRDEKPILLLDDLFDKLDAGRVERLMHIVSREEFGQIFITDCNRTRLKQILGRMDSPHLLFEVSAGEAKQHEQQ